MSENSNGVWTSELESSSAYGERACGVFLVAAERPHRDFAHADLLGEGDELAGVGEPEDLVGCVVDADHRRDADHLPELAGGERRAVEACNWVNVLLAESMAYVPICPAGLGARTSP